MSVGEGRLGSLVGTIGTLKTSLSAEARLQKLLVATRGAGKSLEAREGI